MRKNTKQSEKCRVQNVGLIDNWQLELAGRILAAADSFSHLPLGERVILERYLQLWVGSLQEGVISLLQLIDLLILHDVLLHGNEWSYGWEDMTDLAPLKELLQPIPLQDPELKCLDESRTELVKSYGPVIGKGALRYLTTARQLGVSYWPSPQRSEFLIALSTQRTRWGFILKLTEIVDSTIKEMVTELLVQLDGQLPPRFPGFGTAVLQQCETSASIIPVALEFRGSREAVAFRNWISEMDAYLASGNIRKLAKGLKELTDVTSEIKHSLKISTPDDTDVKLQIGISPSLSLNQQAMRAILKWLCPKKLHLSFLRHHFDRALSNIDLSRQVNRLLSINHVKIW